MRRTALATALLVPLLLAGCGSADSADESSADLAFDESEQEMSEEAGEEMDSDDMADGGAASDAGDRAIEIAAAVPATANRQLARTARLVVEVDDVEQGAAQVVATATRLGGFVADSQVRSGDGPEQFGAFGIITLRVPADALDTALADLGDIAARVVDQSVSTEDLTDQLVDSAARLRNLEALETELLELLGEVRDNDPDASELLVVFNRVNDVRAQIEQIEARRAGFQDRVALATVTVELNPSPVGSIATDVEEESVLEQAWSATRSAFGVLGEIGIWTVVTVLPVLAVLLGVPALLYLGWRRTRTGGSTPPPGTAPPALPPMEPVGVGSESTDADH